MRSLIVTPGKAPITEGVTMGKEEVLRYFEEEVPDMGVIENKPAALVCFARDCETRVEIDPETLVPESDDAVEVNPYDTDGEPTKQVQVFCSGECRNRHYSHGRVLSESGGGDGGE